MIGDAYGLATKRRNAKKLSEMEDDGFEQRCWVRLVGK